MITEISEQLREFFNHYGEDEEGNRRRLQAVATKADMIQDAKVFLTDAMGSLVNMTKGNIHKLKFNYTEFNKDAVIQEIIDYFPNDIGHDVWNKTRALVDELKTADSFDAALDKLEAASQDYCEADAYTKHQKVPTKCDGPKVRLEFQPKTCVVEDAGHSIDCTPAKLVLKKIPGKCVFKYHKAASWTGKECKLEKKWGKDKKESKGGDTFTAGHISQYVKKEVQ